MSETLGKNITLKFPAEIESPDLEHKRMYITIYKSNLMSDIKTLIKEGVNKAKEITEDIVASKKNIVDTTIDTTIKLMKENKEFKGEEELTIILPLPNELNDSQSHDFSVETGIAKSVLSKIPGYETADNYIGKVASNLSKQRVLANPGYFQNYTGSQPRQFTFSFKLIPNSYSEANTMIEIINTLKKYSSPTINLNTFLEAPHFFNFWFANSTLMRLTGIKPCIITNISTNYSGSGILETTMDGMPKYIDLSISVSELRTITQDQWSTK